MSTLPVPTDPSPSAYEEAALREMRLWYEPAEGVLGGAFRSMNRAVRSVSATVHRIPGIDWTVDHVFSGLLDLTNEIAQDSVRREVIYAAYAQAGYPLSSPDDLASLDLSVVDARLDGLTTKYRTLAATEGVATGLAGAAGFVADLFAIAALSLRAMGEFATYFGFDLDDPDERLFALQILNAASEPATDTREASLLPVRQVTQAMARRTTAESVERVAKSRAIRAALRALVNRLMRGKIGQVVPVAGAVIGGGYNAYFISKTCDAAHVAYRRRFLERKYGTRYVEEALHGRAQD